MVDAADVSWSEVDWENLRIDNVYFYKLKEGKMEKLCLNCGNLISEQKELFDSMKTSVPNDRWYIFADYEHSKVRESMCIECYVKNVLLFQQLSKYP